MSLWTRHDIPDLQHKVCIVTGGNTGLGYATAEALAAKRATVVLACRNQDKASAAQRQIVAAHPQADVRVARLDLASQHSVREFASGIAREHAQLDLLINNAGLMVTTRQLTADGFELQFGTNHLGHFLLTGLLLPQLEQAPAARVVSLSSLVHRIGRIHFDDLGAERSYVPMLRYAQSKLACLMFALELQRRLQARGLRTVSLAAHPGVASSELGRDATGFDALAKVINQSAAAGAEPSLRAATDKQARGGDYFGPANWFGARGPAVTGRPSGRARDGEVAARLWQVSEAMTQLHYP